ncbi:hypothetical protein, conserved [Leishmania tarentolae]|uniref:Transmembrane protein n=1 Tax=Leishmania tarentolae TaxID=5689 RepID=A0A640KK33_LEITA|nr:hypothetical protein, conserved [Leishmania tarentolae]
MPPFPTTFPLSSPYFFFLRCASLLFMCLFPVFIFCHSTAVVVITFSTSAGAYPLIMSPIEMYALVRLPRNAVAGVRCAPHTWAVCVRRVSSAMVEPKRTFALNPPPAPFALPSTGVVASEEAAGSTSARSEGAATDAAAPLPSHNPVAQTAKGFRSSTRFKLSPAQVNEKNVPSAREIAQIIPSLRELHAQLPDARELERMYIPREPTLEDNGLAERSKASGEGRAAVMASSTPSSLFQKTTDPLEDLLFGSPNEENAVTNEATATSPLQKRPPSREHVLLAYRALLWGTLLAVLGFSATVVTTMYMCGYYSLRDLQQGVRDKMSHGGERLHATAAAGVTEGSASVDTVVEHYVIDVTHPAEAWRQVQEIWSAVQRLAEEEEKANTSVAAVQSLSPAAV